MKEGGRKKRCFDQDRVKLPNLPYGMNGANCSVLSRLTSGAVVGTHSSVLSVVAHKHGQPRGPRTTLLNQSLVAQPLPAVRSSIHTYTTVH